MFSVGVIVIAVILWRIWLWHNIRIVEDAKASPHIDTDKLMSLPDALLENICNRLTLLDVLAMRCSSRTFVSALADVCNARVTAQYEKVIRYFPIHVIGSLPMRVWFDVEWVEFDARWLGCMGYLDRVQPCDIPGCPFKCCRDSHGRLALLMRRKKDVAVLFQRYTDLDTTWAFASKTLPIGGCPLSDSMVARLALWLSHEYAI